MVGNVSTIQHVDDKSRFRDKVIQVQACVKIMKEWEVMVEVMVGEDVVVRFVQEAPCFFFKSRQERQW